MSGPVQSLTELDSSPLHESESHISNIAYTETFFEKEERHFVISASHGDCVR